MLILSRGLNDKVVFPKLGITVEVLRIAGSRVRVGIDAPKSVRVLRHELEQYDDAVDEAVEQAAASGLDMHALRNRLNSASLALGLAEKQINAGCTSDALRNMRRAIAEFDRLEKEAQGDAPHESGEMTDGAHAPGSPRALLIDDDANETELLAGFLQMSGFKVDTAGDGVQAMVHLGNAVLPDVVLLDMHMPRMDGAETVRAIRQTPELQDLPLFAVTGAASDDMPVTVGREGVNRWFRKPIKPQTLVNSINEELGLTVA